MITRAYFSTSCVPHMAPDPFSAHMSWPYYAEHFGFSFQSGANCGRWSQKERVVSCMGGSVCVGAFLNSRFWSCQIFFLDFALNQIILSLNRVMTGQEKAHPVLLHLLWKYLGQINGIKPWASLSSAPNIRSHTRWLHFIRCVLGFGLLGFWILLQLWSMQSYETLSF